MLDGETELMFVLVKLEVYHLNASISCAVCKVDKFVDDRL